MAEFSYTLGAIIPKTAPDTKIYENMISDALTKTGVELSKELLKPTKRWKKPVTMDVRINKRKGTVRVSTKNKVYLWTNAGTRPRIIVPKKAKRLVFRSKFLSKTVPGSLMSRSGRRGGSLIFAKKVRHPGIRARNWHQIVAKKFRKRTQARFNIAIANANRKQSRL